MRIRWQLAAGGAVAALGTVLLAYLYLGAGTAAMGADNRLTNPGFLLLAVGFGGLAGLFGSRLVERPVTALAAAVRHADSGADLSAPDSSAPAELVDLYRAIKELHARQTSLAGSLTAENRRLQVILDSITEGILVTDLDGRVLLANRALRDLFDVRGETVRRMAVEVVRNAAVGEAIDAVLETHSPVSCEIVVGSAQRSLDVQAAPIVPPGTDEPSGSVTVFYEITRLRRLERMRADFVANVSHELRTPLTAIKGCAETLQDGALDDREAAARFVGVIASHADRLTGLLEDLLVLSRLESDRVELEPTTVAAQRLADTAREAVQQTAAAKKLTIEAEVSEGVAVRCDRRLIEQALINFVDNAVKYTPEGGTVWIRASRLSRTEAVLQLARRRWSAGGVEHVGQEEGDVVVFEVADTGIGIPADEVGRVFERFYRVDKGRSRAMGGTGLGLSIVRHAIELHGERVFLDSDLGGGSVFGFTLPAA
jgi:two-component system phosphate regulon sensor histidine kinase PhoR